MDESAEGFTTCVIGICSRKRAAEVTDASEARMGIEARMLTDSVVMSVLVRKAYSCVKA